MNTKDKIRIKIKDRRGKGKDAFNTVNLKKFFLKDLLNEQMSTARHTKVIFLCCYVSS